MNKRYGSVFGYQKDVTSTQLVPKGTGIPALRKRKRNIDVVDGDSCQLLIST